MLALGKMKWRIALAIVTVLILCRATIPISANGDWTGTLTKCACGDYWFARFQDGHVKWYAHSGDEGSTPTDWGTYEKIGRNTYRWHFERGGATVTVRVGWLVSSVDGVPGYGRFYCWCYPLFWKANRVVREMNANEKVKRAKQSKSDAPNQTLEPTPVVAFSSAFAADSTGPAWLSLGR